MTHDQRSTARNSQVHGQFAARNRTVPQIWGPPGLGRQRLTRSRVRFPGGLGFEAPLDPGLCALLLVAGKPKKGKGGLGEREVAFLAIWVWLKIEQEGKPQVLVHLSTYQGSIFWYRIFDPQPSVS